MLTKTAIASYRPAFDRIVSALPNDPALQPHIAHLTKLFRQRPSAPRGAVELRRSREVFTIATTEHTLRVIGWTRLSGVLMMTENSLRTKFSRGNGQFTYPIRTLIATITRPYEYATPDAHTVKTYQEMCTALGL